MSTRSIYVRIPTDEQNINKALCNLLDTIGIQSKPTTTRQITTTRPTISCSLCDARGLKTFQISTVKMVLELLKADESEDMRAAIITANIKPTAPVGRMSKTNLKKKTPTLVHGKV